MSDVRYDKLGRPINIGDYAVCIVRNNGSELTVGQVIKITPKRIRVQYLPMFATTHSTMLRQSSEIVIIDNNKYVTMAILKGVTRG